MNGQELVTTLTFFSAVVPSPNPTFTLVGVRLI
jgi:hypothetical protein